MCAPISGLDEAAFAVCFDAIGLDFFALAAFRQ
jgi:hypothetical protein